MLDGTERNSRDAGIGRVSKRRAKSTDPDPQIREPRVDATIGDKLAAGAYKKCLGIFEHPFVDDDLFDFSRDFEAFVSFEVHADFFHHGNGALI